MDAIWNCEECGREIEDGDGSVVNSVTERYEQAEARAQWQAEHPGALSGSDLAALPEQSRWRALHHNCYEEGNDYAIGVERIRTMEHALAWTIHLLEKGWLQETDWDDTIRGVFLPTYP